MKSVQGDKRADIFVSTVYGHEKNSTVMQQLRADQPRSLLQAIECDGSITTLPKIRT